ncbi:MAG TPA: type II secretion system protein [Armatimonadota bacterium]|nr:type II secretion system protein [Armatimonadota bacterium]
MRRVISRQKGFSLIELLIVIAIIGVLASLLFPVFASVKKRSHSASCQSNLRQIWMAFEMYLQDWDDHYPNTGDPFLWMGRKWRWPMKKYLSLAADPTPGNPMVGTKREPSVLLCPADNLAPAQWDGTSYAYSMTFYMTVAQINSMTSISQTWSGSPPCSSQCKSSVEYPAHKALMSEWLSNHESPAVGWDSWSGARNYLFADGHVQLLKAKQIKPANDGCPDINLTREGIHGKDID